jgi:hypothetical protein
MRVDDVADDIHQEGERERDASACMRRHQAFAPAVAPMAVSASA